MTELFSRLITRLDPADEFSPAECRALFLLVCVGFFILTLVPLSTRILVGDPWGSFVAGTLIASLVGVIAGLFGVCCYVLTLQFGAWRYTLITAAFCFVIGGTVSGFVTGRDAREDVLRPPTKEQEAKDWNDFCDAFLIGGTLSALIGGAAVFVYRGIIRQDL